MENYVQKEVKLCSICGRFIETIDGKYIKHPLNFISKTTCANSYKRHTNTNSPFDDDMKEHESFGV